MTGDGHEHASRSGTLLARLMRTLEPCPPEALGPLPPWMHWNSTGGSLWPPNAPVDRMDQSLVPAFASTRTPTLAPIRSSASFIRAYELARDRTFTDDERQIAWAASLWPALHNARGEYLFQSSPVAATAVIAQAAERLALARA